MHLRFCYMTAPGCGENGHACTVMKKLGITYQQSTPQSMGDQFWFWNCENVPEKLPKYITELKANPMECIGFGLNKEDAEKIKNYKVTKRKESPMKKLLITLITISMFAITACGDGSEESPAPQPDPVEKPFVWGESTWGDAGWGNE